MRVLALDYGERRIGVAVSDARKIFAHPLLMLDRRKLGNGLWKRLDELVREHDVERIVLGLPLNMDGSRGPQALEVEEFGLKLGKRTRLPIEYLDERWTTVEASRALRDVGMRSRQAREHVDATAATLLLRTYLDRRQLTEAVP